MSETSLIILVYLFVCSQHHHQSEAARGVLPCLSHPHPGHSADSRWGENAQWCLTLVCHLFPRSWLASAACATCYFVTAAHNFVSLFLYSHFFRVSSVHFRGQRPGWRPPGTQVFETNTLIGSPDMRLLSFCLHTPSYIENWFWLRCYSTTGFAAANTARLEGLPDAARTRFVRIVLCRFEVVSLVNWN